VESASDTVVIVPLFIVLHWSFLKIRFTALLVPLLTIALLYKSSGDVSSEEVLTLCEKVL